MKTDIDRPTSWVATAASVLGVMTGIVCLIGCMNNIVMGWVLGSNPGSRMILPNPHGPDDAGAMGLIALIFLVLMVFLVALLVLLAIARGLVGLMLTRAAIRDLQNPSPRGR